MKKINLDITINAPREKVWDAIVSDAKYRGWAAAFMEGSFFEGGWNKGDSIHFLVINQNGEKEGMVSEIAESIYPEFISIQHLGFILDGVEDRTSDAVKAWVPSFENYSFEKIDEHTTKFSVDMDIEDQHHANFTELWGKALQKLKAIAEAK